MPGQRSGLEKRRNAHQTLPVLQQPNSGKNPTLKGLADFANEQYSDGLSTGRRVGSFWIVLELTWLVMFDNSNANTYEEVL
jgi:hypothetical protein